MPEHPYDPDVQIAEDGTPFVYVYGDMGRFEPIVVGISAHTGAQIIQLRPVTQPKYTGFKDVGGNWVLARGHRSYRP